MAQPQGLTRTWSDSDDQIQKSLLVAMLVEHHAIQTEIVQSHGVPPARSRNSTVGSGLDLSLVQEEDGVSINDEFCIKNEKICIKNEEFCIKNDEICSSRRPRRARCPKMMNFVFKMTNRLHLK